MKKIKFIIVLSLLFFSASCTRSSDQSEAASKTVKTLKDCAFDVFVFASYRDNQGKMTFDFEKFFGWSADGTHDYAVEEKAKVKSASIEIIRENTLFKKVDIVLEKAGRGLVHLNDNREVVNHVKTIDSADYDKSVLRFVLVGKDKKVCKKDYKIF